MIVSFDKKTVFSVDSFGPVDHERILGYSAHILSALLTKGRPPAFFRRGVLSCFVEILMCWVEVPAGTDLVVADSISCGIFYLYVLKK
jgi:hypothetical protein